MKVRKIVFSPHAIKRIKEREINEELIKEAIALPDKIEKSSIEPLRFLVKKLYFNKKLQKEHLLLIVLEVQPDLISVITVIDTSKISKYF